MIANLQYQAHHNPSNVKSGFFSVISLRLGLNLCQKVFLSSINFQTLAMLAGFAVGIRFFFFLSSVTKKM